MINVLSYQILVSTIRGKKMKSSYKNNKFKISIPKWNEKLVLTDESYFVSDLKAYFEYIIKKT